MTIVEKPKGKKGNKPASPDKQKRENSIFIRMTTLEKDSFMDFTNNYLGSTSLFFRMAGRNFMKIHNYSRKKDVYTHIKLVKDGNRISIDSQVIHSKEIFEKYVGYAPDTTDTSFLVKLTDAEFCEYVGVADFLGISPGMYLRMCGIILMDEKQRCPEVVSALEILNPSGLLVDGIPDRHSK